MPFSNEDRKKLLEIAQESIRMGVREGHPLRVNLKTLSPRLQEVGAAFVTLETCGELRGCIGELEAHRPLAESVSENAFYAAFRDSRFSPVDSSEVDRLDIKISVLSPGTEIHFSSENDLIQKIRPGVDGLIMSFGRHRGTFLPAVWESLPDAKDFIQELKIKSGLKRDFWDPAIRVSRYTVESI